jgi:cytoskeleton protein RodZ
MSEIIGQELLRARQEQNIPLEQAADETHIRIRFLEALEKGNFSQLPSKAHVRGFLRAYADYLGINPDSLLNILDQPESRSLETEIVAQEVQTQEISASPESSILIFKDLGEDLQRQREMLGFSLEEVERNTRIRQHYLEALEAGDLNGLPSPVQGRGMLQNFAAFLGLDVERVLLQFADGLQAQHAEKRAVQPVSPEIKPERHRRRLPYLRSFPGDWLLGMILIAAVLAFVIWGIFQISSFQATPNLVETVPSVAEALQVTPKETLGETPAPTVTALPSPAETDISPDLEGNPVVPPPEENPAETPITTLSDAPVQVYVSVLRRAWMRVTVDGNIEFEGRVIPGSAYPFSGEFQIEILTGNGAALQLFFNDTDMGVMGVYGEVVYRVFTPEGVLLPTPTPSPIPTNTPLASPTLESTSAP